MIALLLACVLDRTGQSATSAYERELALQASRTAALESETDVQAQRVGQLEEVTRYLGQQEAAKMENLDQVRAEVQRLRGTVEEMEHASAEAAKKDAALADDVDYRLDYLEVRVAALEKSLGQKPPPPPVPGGEQPAVTTDPKTGEVQMPTDVAPAEVELPANADEMLALAEKHLLEGRPKAARLVLEAYLKQYPNDPRNVEARYRLAETYFNDGEYQKAVVKFDDVVNADPKGQWAPWAVLRQGECFEKMGKPKEAALFYQDVVARYPKSKAAKEAKTKLGQ